MILVQLFVLQAVAQISPGNLTKAHAELEGLENCTQCHEIGNKVEDNKCLDCHKEISARIKSNKGFHSSREVKNKKCFQCHNEHHGRNFEIIHFEKKTFDHSLTGYELKGKHKENKCEDCHKSNFISDAKLKSKPNSFLGLSTECASCHNDFHEGELGKSCESCHNEKSFRPATGFDHSKSNFVLTGAHTKTDCVKCHEIKNTGNKKSQKFKGLNYTFCTTCHTDVHKNKFGSNCAECHSTESFKQIRNLKKFDHARTNFQLVGMHIKVNCSECHSGSYTKKIKHDKCLDCHTDYHKGDFKKGQYLSDCAECHDESGFTPSLFTLERHNKLSFSLMGGHLAVPCESCHKIENNWKFKFVSSNCSDCHQNVHGNSISQKFIGNNECSRCHDVSSWKTIRFDHNETDFKLEGKHKGTECRSCHFKTTFSGKVVHLFSQLSQKCESCHEDKHAGQFAGMAGTDCSRCHATIDWKATKFNHSQTQFPLTGKHENTACLKCHKEITSEKGTFIKYKFESFLCADCHS